MRKFLLCFVLVAVAVGCDPTKERGSSTNGNNVNDGNLTLVATTGQINDALVNITKGTDASIHLFCGPGVDPHSFSASADDVQKMVDANLIVYNGFHLEAKLSESLHETFESKIWSMSSAFPENLRMDWIEDGQKDPDAPYDPHIWNHLPGWSNCVMALAEKLAEVSPENAGQYRKNASDYCQQINEVHKAAKKKLAQLPVKNRFIVSAHDAFNYFADQYELEPLAVLGIGNNPEADIRTMQEVANTICEKKIPAIFLESITNPKITDALKESCKAKGWTVKLVEQPLYSDDLGESEPQNTFLGAFESNVDIIFQALK